MWTSMTNDRFAVVVLLFVYCIRWTLTLPRYGFEKSICIKYLQQHI